MCDLNEVKGMDVFMKKKIITVLCLFLLLPNQIFALEYNSKISGIDTIYTFVRAFDQNAAYSYTKLYVNIDNIENIDSFDMYIKFDMEFIVSDLYRDITDQCRVSNVVSLTPTEKLVVIHYKYQEKYEEYLNKANLITILLRESEQFSYPKTAPVEIFFKNAKDKDQNPITINSSSKTYRFKTYGTPEEEQNTTNNNTDSSEMNNKNDAQDPTDNDSSTSGDSIQESETITNNSNPTDNNVSSSLDHEVTTDNSTEANNKNQSTTNNNSNSSNETNNKNYGVNGNSITNSNEKNQNSEIINTETQKSNNNYASKIEIKDYKIDFEKEKNEYTIYTDENTNQLDVAVTVEDSNAIYNIIGADNLKQSNYKIFVEITAEDNSKRIYTINVKTQENSQTEENIAKVKLKKTKIFIIGTIIFGIVLLVILLIVVIQKSKRKIMK